MAVNTAPAGDVADATPKSLTLRQMMAALDRVAASEEVDVLLQDVADEDLSDAALPYFGEAPGSFDEVAFDPAPADDEAILQTLQDPNDVTDPAAIGGLAGRWMPRAGGDDLTDPGQIRGRWFDADGAPLGVLHGFYRPTPNRDLPAGLSNPGVFQMRIIHADGRFRGLVRGWYAYNAEGQGAFHGRWFDRTLRLVGLTRGRWTDVADEAGGELAGRWAGVDLCAASGSLANDPNADAASAWDAASAGQAGIDTAAFADLAAAALAIDSFDPTGELAGLDGELDLLSGATPPCVDPQCEHGFLRGRYVPEFDPQTRFDGLWRGRWIAADGDPAGWVLGTWTRRDRGGDGGGAEEPGLASPPHDRPASMPMMPRGRAVAGGALPGGSPEAGDLGEFDGGGVDGAAAFDPNAPGPRPHRPRIHGRFRGVIVNDAREVIGYVEGVYGRGVRRVGVLLGRHFDAAGEFNGRLRGRWQDDPWRAGGSIFGVWGAASPEADGGGLDGEDADAAAAELEAVRDD